MVRIIMAGIVSFFRHTIRLGYKAYLLLVITQVSMNPMIKKKIVGIELTTGIWSRILLPADELRSWNVGNRARV